MNLIEQLDAVFFYVKSKSQFGVSKFNLKTNIEKEHQIVISDMVFREMIEFLIKDEKIRIVNRALNSKETYMITVSGLIFDGYVATENRKSESKKWKTDIESKTLKNAKTLTMLTWILAITSAIAALYYIIEIAKNFK